MSTTADLHTVPLSEVIAPLGTSAQGIEHAQAVERLRRDGPNEITQKRRSPLLKFARYFLGADPMDDQGGWPGYWTQWTGTWSWSRIHLRRQPAGSASTATVRNARRTFAAWSSV